MPDAAPEITRLLARFVVEAAAERLPPTVRREAARAYLNFVGCALGGASHPAVAATLAAAEEFVGAERLTVIGHGRRLGALDAAMLNCLSSAAHAYDDTHLAAVIHPTGPVAGPLLALAERKPTRGEEFLLALALGIEVSCRLAVMLTVPPAEPQLGWYMTGVAGPLGAAAGAARLLRLDERQTVAALGLAASQAAGFRQTHGSMCTSVVPALAARAGLWSALLARRGVTSGERALEGSSGYAHVFAPKPHLAAAVDGLGERWEMLANVYKPYPCGIVIHPALDGCLEIARAPGFAAGNIAKVRLGVHPLCLRLCDRPAPPDAQLAQVSLQHWAAAALARGAAGLAEGSEARVHDPAVLAVRATIEAAADESVGRDGATVEVEMRDGTRHRRRIEHGIGSLDRPMSDDELDAKFLGQAQTLLPAPRAREILALCRRLPELDDAAEPTRGAFPQA